MLAKSDVYLFYKGESELHFASGVAATFDRDMLSTLRLSQKEATGRPSIQVDREREPTLKQIEAMLDESAVAERVGAASAALLVAWAAMEALLRRTALHAGLKGRIGVNPQMLLRDLSSAGVLPSAETRLLEEVRQVRVAAAHGLSPVPVRPTLLLELHRLAVRLLIKARSVEAAE
ncbi:hypothetical protein K2O51_33575 (plasmid) [Cupriavidus pinatubonensis]|uniref:hypothetical protein n=1 Tax=Cupriavidus pinatubonensis TaxID=248026 RepID=UPI001C735208|nr:hypothetical protein [Cupriavidus pinatubonensis]QYY33778.1 hypothetical protein K2O51_33575 [Cupriavidus pinatubonensis]